MILHRPNPSGCNKINHEKKSRKRAASEGAGLNVSGPRFVGLIQWTREPKAHSRCVTPTTVVLRLFCGCSKRYHLSGNDRRDRALNITVTTVIAGQVKHVRTTVEQQTFGHSTGSVIDRALGLLDSASPKSQPTRRNVVSHSLPP